SGPAAAAKHDIPTFKIEVRNTGRAVAKNVVVEEKLPAGLEFSNSKPATKGDNPLVWSLGDLEPGQSRVVEYSAIPSVVGALKAGTLVKAEGGVRQEASHTLEVGEPVLSVVMKGPAHRLVGRPATYRIAVRNTGTWPAKFVTLSDELPAEI